MKRFFAILLLICLVAPFGGAYLGFRIEKSHVRKMVKRQIKAGISKDELIEFKFLKKDTTKNLRWEHEREFEFEDKMYDIVERIYNKDSVTYRCWCDSIETQINTQYNKLLAQALGNNPQKPDNKKQLIDYLKVLYYSDLNSDSDSRYLLSTDKLYTHYKLFNSSYIITPPGPPPKSG